MTDYIGPNRLRMLETEWRSPDGDCPLVIAAVEMKAHEIEMRHFSGGRDATYVRVSRPGLQHASPALPATRRSGAEVTIRYAPSVEGTTIIYDATAHTLQGKARPFICDLSVQARRIYALMPYQIENIRVRTEKRADKIRFRVSFLDALGEPIQAALPFEFRLIAPDRRELHRTDTTTNRSGEYDQTPAFEWPPSSQRWQVAVRSLLTGNEESAYFASP